MTKNNANCCPLCKKSDTTILDQFKSKEIIQLYIKQ